MNSILYKQLFIINPFFFHIVYPFEMFYIFHLEVLFLIHILIFYHIKILYSLFLFLCFTKWKNFIFLGFAHRALKCSYLFLTSSYVKLDFFLTFY